MFWRNVIFVLVVTVPPWQAILVWMCGDFLHPTVKQAGYALGATCYLIAALALARRQLAKGDPSMQPLEQKFRGFPAWFMQTVRHDGFKHDVIIAGVSLGLLALFGATIWTIAPAIKFVAFGLYIAVKWIAIITIACLAAVTLFGRGPSWSEILKGEHHEPKRTSFGNGSLGTGLPN